jgi:hypothetical protein
MAMTIGPVGGEAERRRLLRWHSVGVLIGSAVMGLLLALAGSLVGAEIGWLDGAISVVLAVVLLAWGVRFLSGRGLVYPRSKWQVPEHWRSTLPLPFTVFAYGVMLGVGWVTDVVSPVYWLFAGLTVLMASPGEASVGWAAYAFARLALTARATSRAHAANRAHGDQDLQPATCAPSARVFGAMRTTSVVVLIIAAAGLAASSVS